MSDRPAQEPAMLVTALSHISPYLLGKAEAFAWTEHEEGRLTDNMYFIVIRRLRALAAEQATTGQESK